MYKKLKINGVEYPLAVNISGVGAPTNSIEANVGMFYMNENNGEVYKRTREGWKHISTGGGGGVSPIVTTTPIDNGYEVTFTDVEGDKTITILNGEKGDKGDRGEQGEQGEPGYTPQRGVDYWTTDDKVEIKGYVNTKVENALTTVCTDIEKYGGDESDYSVISAINQSLLNYYVLLGLINDNYNEFVQLRDYVEGVEEELQMLNEGGIQ